MTVTGGDVGVMRMVIVTDNGVEKEWWWGDGGVVAVSGCGVDGCGGDVDDVMTGIAAMPGVAIVVVNGSIIGDGNENGATEVVVMLMTVVIVAGVSGEGKVVVVVVVARTWR